MRRHHTTARRRPIRAGRLTDPGQRCQDVLTRRIAGSSAVSDTARHTSTPDLSQRLARTSLIEPYPTGARPQPLSTPADALAVGSPPAFAYTVAAFDCELRPTGGPLRGNDNWMDGFCRYYGQPLISQDQAFDRVRGLRMLPYSNPHHQSNSHERPKPTQQRRYLIWGQMKAGWDKAAVVIPPRPWEFPRVNPAVDSWHNRLGSVTGSP